ncbi:hypothetical protein [Chitinophaga oryzae]|uniref:hypothetical protein n=1 Tax=Chitinophaga oryzae TaxID=2725414 RepID=UPI00215C817C|nr:hypothetical protein [Chitinophaga oryzae]
MPDLITAFRPTLFDGFCYSTMQNNIAIPVEITIPKRGYCNFQGAPFTVDILQAISYVFVLDDFFHALWVNAHGVSLPAEQVR